MPVQPGTTIKVDDRDIVNDAIAQYTFYGRGGGYGHLRIEDEQGNLLVDQITHLGENKTFASSVVTGHFELGRGGLTVHLGYVGSCDCKFPSGGSITYDTSKVINNDDMLVASMLYATYDIQGGSHDNDDAVVSITFTKKQKNL